MPNVRRKSPHSQSEYQADQQAEMRLFQIWMTQQGWQRTSQTPTPSSSSSTPMLSLAPLSAQTNNSSNALNSTSGFNFPTTPDFQEIPADQAQQQFAPQLSKITPWIPGSLGTGQHASGFRVLPGHNTANAINLAIMGPSQAGPSGQQFSAARLAGHGLFGKKDGSSSAVAGSLVPRFPATGANRDGNNKRRDMPVKFGKLDFVSHISS
jgi:hypothetical protein